MQKKITDASEQNTSMCSLIAITASSLISGGSDFPVFHLNIDDVKTKKIREAIVLVLKKGFKKKRQAK